MSSDYKNYEGFKCHLEDRSILKDDRGAHKTESLFVEVIQAVTAKRYTPIYSLRDYDNKGCESAYQIYINSIDENDAALKLVGSLAHWRKLCALKWFINGRPECQFEGLKQWRADMAARDATEAKRVLLERCKEDNVPAARALEALSSKVEKPNKVSSGDVQSKDDSNITDFLDVYKGKS